MGELPRQNSSLAPPILGGNLPLRNPGISKPGFRAQATSGWKFGLGVKEKSWKLER